jgi:hypothetical protein
MKLCKVDVEKKCSILTLEEFHVIILGASGFMGPDQTKTAQESKNFGCARNQPACHMLWESDQESTNIACGGGTSHTAQRCHAFLLSESRIY